MEKVRGREVINQVNQKEEIREETAKMFKGEINGNEKRNRSHKGCCTIQDK